ncbi:tetraphosphate phosphorylase 2 (ATP adenylyltransferase) [Colletotrichum musicola]|uniref:Tetraphosphate phosphorylase 2 (ATP adenylyltransferase) n=1 Tax=Colletotrichum musicola TaxID=2175873 RepID=A0A8H6MQ00_9PEZI|nr:tetraphosphate phosphorylase 2 (ATP adenylyltransferase) [Colletotrichum musicola]
MASLDEKEIEATFDKLVELGIIRYNHSAAIPLTDNGFQFEFRVCPAFKGKPFTLENKVPTSSNSEPETFGPTSDINKSHPDQIIGYINGTHILALNIYPVYRPQFLVLTVDSSLSQDDPLSLEDIAAAWSALKQFESPMFVIYNCTTRGGCSRRHKHLQVIPRPQPPNNEQGFRLFPDVEEGGVRVPFVHFLNRFEAGGRQTSPEEIHRTYCDLLGRCRQVLGVSENVPCPHNVVMVKEWILVIPRRASIYKGLMVNTTGMLGMPALPDPRPLDVWRLEGPAKVLGEFGVPAGVTDK